jgi:Flp pilus assembly CpaE family ATPase
MYPLKVVLIGIDSSNLSSLEAELRTAQAKIELQFSSIALALEHLPSSAEERQLFIVELRDEKTFQELRRFIDRHPTQPLMVLSHLGGDSEMMIRWMRSGINQIVGLPLVAEDFRRALDRIVRQFGFQSTIGQVIAVSGVSEGCGVTTISINLAAEIASRYSKRVLLVEMRPRMGRLAIALNAEPRFTTLDLFSNLSSIDAVTFQRALTPINDRLSILPAPYQSMDSATIQPSEVGKCLHLFRQVADVIILDMPYTFDETYFRTLSSADHLILVAEQHIPSLHALLVLRDALKNHHLHAEQHIVVNHYSSGRSGANLKEISELLHGEHFLTIHEDEDGVQESLNNGESLRECAPRSVVVKDIDRLMETIIADQPDREVEKQSQGFFRKVGHLLGVR